MPIPMQVARWNRVGLNRVTRPFASRLPGFGVVVHTGRKSGRTYRTPVNVFRVAGGFVIALTYGVETDWIKNVLASGGCEIETRGRLVRCTSPRIYHDESRRDIGLPARPILRLINVADFMSVSAVPSGEQR
jgi:deazaflavin-dependent oxidoreductase (nitroreductase family)